VQRQNQRFTGTARWWFALVAACFLLGFFACVRRVAMSVVALDPVDRAPGIERAVDPLKNERSNKTLARYYQPGPAIRVTVEVPKDLERLARRLGVDGVYYSAAGCTAPRDLFAVLSRGPVYLSREQPESSGDRGFIYEFYLPKDLRRSVSESRHVLASRYQGFDLYEELRKAESDGLCVWLAGHGSSYRVFRTNSVRVPVSVCDGRAVIGACPAADHSGEESTDEGDPAADRSDG